MNRIQTGELELTFARDFMAVKPDSPSLLGVGLVCFDAENVVLPYKGEKVWPGYKEHVAGYHDAGINTCMITNMPDGDRAERVAEQLNTPFAHRGMWPESRDMSDPGMASKSHPEMYQHALRNVGMGSAGNQAVMVDDQLKNIKGIQGIAEFTRFIWTFPNGLKVHPGVLLGRVVEVPCGFGLIARQNIRKLRTGTYGEW